MKIWKDQQGFSLIELIIVIGIAAIIAGISLRMLGQISTTNTEKVVKTISDALTKQQMKSMSKEVKPYLYIYERNGKYYYIFSESNTYDYSTMGTNGKEIGNGVTISYKVGSTEYVIGGIITLKISYKRDGSFDDAPDSIIIKGKPDRTIKLNKITGKHVIQ